MFFKSILQSKLCNRKIQSKGMVRKRFGNGSKTILNLKAQKASWGKVSRHFGVVIIQ